MRAAIPRARKPAQAQRNLVLAQGAWGRPREAFAICDSLLAAAPDQMPAYRPPRCDSNGDAEHSRLRLRPARAHVCA